MKNLANKVQQASCIVIKIGSALLVDADTGRVRSHWIESLAKDITLLNPVPLGIVCGLFFGKQLGVFVFSYLSIKLNLAEKPTNSNWVSFYAVSVLTGIGFTMSLFVGNLAFANDMQYSDGVKIGVLVGSLLSTLFGYFLLLMGTRR